MDIVIVGGGPSGLAAAYESVNHGATVAVLERMEQVGGLARTTEVGETAGILVRIASLRRIVRYMISSPRWLGRTSSMLSG